jgi:hypothetical protein
MPNYFYTDINGQKQGPINGQQLQELAMQGIIGPHTLMATDTGHRGVAGQIPGLFVSVPPPVPKQVFCTNCGHTVSEQAVGCMSCGLRPTGHRIFCRQCGSTINPGPGQVVCRNCGAEIPSDRGGTKSKVVAGLLGIFLGGFGAHKFYVGSWGWGLVFLLIPPFCLLFSSFVTAISGGLLVPLTFPLLLIVPVPAIIGFVEGIMFFIMSEESFKMRYSYGTWYRSAFRW